MTRARFFPLMVMILGGFFVLSQRSSWSQDVSDASPEARANSVPARFLRVEEPITDAALALIQDTVPPFLAVEADRLAGPSGKKPEPIIVFEFVPGSKSPGSSSLGASGELARFLSREINISERTRARTIAFVPESLSGYAVLAVLACDEIVMGSGATLGPITPDGQPVDEDALASVKTLARRKRRESQLGLFLGMVDKTLDVRRLKLADGQIHYILAEELDAFSKEHAVTENAPAWEAGGRGVLKAETARGGLVQRLADDRGAIKIAYGLDSTSDLVAPESETAEIRIEGPITRGVESFVRRRLGEEVSRGTKQIFLRINSEGGEDRATELILTALRDLEGIRTIAYVEDGAMGLSALIPLACNEIVFKEGARMGDIRSGGNRNDDIDEAKESALALLAQETAAKKGHPPAVARAMADSKSVVVQVKNLNTGAVEAILESDVKPANHAVQDTIKPAGVLLTLNSSSALSLGMALKVVKSDDELWSAYGLRTPPKSGSATWVDGLVHTLNTPWMSGILLFVGLFMLILELKLPGVGLPAIISVLAFLLFFWSHYLGGTADQLEILLFIVGLVCLALELFVFPGFAVFGLSGILLILVSVIMASHTFIWPSREYEYRQMSRTLLEVTGAILTVSVGAVVVGRYFPSLPLFRRMVLQPPDLSAEANDPISGKPGPEGDMTYFFLLGEVGQTTTALKPTGKARFGEILVDVTADGFYIEPGANVEVVEVHGSRVIVKRV